MSRSTESVGTRMRKWIALLVLLVSACGGGDGAAIVVGDGAPDSTLATSNTVARQGDDFFVPDFRVGLADGTIFDSADVDTPIYVVFWAEW